MGVEQYSLHYFDPNAQAKCVFLSFCVFYFYKKIRGGEWAGVIRHLFSSLSTLPEPCQVSFLVLSFIFIYRMAPARKNTAPAHQLPKLFNPCGTTRNMQKILLKAAHESFLDFLKADTCELLSVYQERQAVEGLERLRQAKL